MQFLPQKNGGVSRLRDVRRGKDRRVLVSMTEQEICLGQNLLAAVAFSPWIALVMIAER